MKRITSLFMAIFLTLSMAACDLLGNNTPLKPENIDLWTTYTTKKIKKDMAYNDEEKFAPSINVNMALGEYESAQLIITPDKDVPYYNVSISDLTHSNGVDKFSKDNIAICKQEYMYVARVIELPDINSPGYYPDALIPMEAVVEYKENNIKAGENQGIYFTFNTRPELDENNRAIADENGNYNYIEPGLYTGVITIDFKDFKSTVPVSVNVSSATVSEESHLKADFHTRKYFGTADLDYTQERKDAYNQFMVDYRIMTTNLIVDGGAEEQARRNHADKAYHYMQDPRVSCITFTMSSKAQTNAWVQDGRVIDGHIIPYDYYFGPMSIFLDKACETGFDMFAKMRHQVDYIDEAVIMNRQDDVFSVLGTYKQCRSQFIEYIQNDTTRDYSKISKEQLIESIKQVSVVCAFNNPGGMFDGVVEIFSPTTPAYSTEAGRELYKGLTEYGEEVEKWTYYPNVVPYNNVALETSLLDCRTTTWWMFEYNVEGLLYWGFDVTKNGEQNACDEYFTTNRDVFSNHNGDGWLCYPGGQYGLDTPISSIRLEAIRDGIEEYELLYALNESYKNLGFSADTIIKNLGSNIYSGVSITTSDELFVNTRDSLIKLVELASTKANFCVVNSEDDGLGTVSYEIYLNSGYELKNNGTTITTKRPAENDAGYIYSVQVKKDQNSNILNLTFEVDGEEYTYSQNLGGKVVSCGVEKIGTAFSGLVGFDTSLFTTTLQEDSVKVYIPGSNAVKQDDCCQFISYNNTQLLKEIFVSQNNKFVIVLNNESSVDSVLSVRLQYKEKGATKSKLTELVAEYKVVRGRNTIEITIPEMNYDSIDISGLIFIFDSKLEAAKQEKVLYIQDFFIASK